MTEDADVANGKLTTSGTAWIDDPDTRDWPSNESFLENFVAETLSGSGNLGALTIGADGAWTYEVDNDLAAIQALDTGDVLQDVFTVSQGSFLAFVAGASYPTTEMGGATTEIVIDIWGTDDFLL